MLVKQINSEHSLCVTLNMPTTNDIKNVIISKLSSINFKVSNIRFGGKCSSHSEENEHDDDNDY